MSASLATGPAPAPSAGESAAITAPESRDRVDWPIEGQKSVSRLLAREAEAGNLHVNWGSQWRVDLMPYGGLKESGFGKEGPKYAVQEMSELKMVVFHLNS